MLKNKFDSSDEKVTANHIRQIKINLKKLII